MAYCHFCSKDFPDVEVRATVTGDAAKAAETLGNMYALVVCNECKAKIEERMKA